MSYGRTFALWRAAAPDWDAYTRHAFVQALGDGSLPRAAFLTYLVQDYRFLDAFLSLLGGAMATADTAAARLRLGRFVGMVSTDENDYFLRSFAALGISDAARAAIPDSAPTAGFQAIMREAAATRSYAAALSVLTAAEWLYLDWASRAGRCGRTCGRTWGGGRGARTPPSGRDRRARSVQAVEDEADHQFCHASR